MAARSAKADHEAAEVDPAVDAHTAFQPLDVYELAEPVGSMAGSDSGRLRACPRCGEEDTASARFCRGCGVGFIGAPEDEARRPSPLPAIVVAVILLLALIAGGVFAYRALRPSSPPPLPAPVPTAAPAKANAAPPVVSAPAPPVAAVPQPSAAQPQPKPAAVAPRAARPAILDPVWLRWPSRDEVSEFYPPLAADEDVEGEAVINCAVTDLGRLSSCKVVGERPARQGFGAATLRLASRFRMRTTTRSGQPVAGRRVRVPVLWHLDD